MEMCASRKATNRSETQGLQLNEIRRTITTFTRVLHWFLIWARRIQSIPPHFDLCTSHFKNILPLHLVLLAVSFILCLDTKTFNVVLFTPTRPVCPSHSIFLDLDGLLILSKGTRYEAPHYAVFFTLLSFHASRVQILPWCIKRE
jgi:hypothetical protein